MIEHEPTVLEYARFHGLCSDYTQELQRLDCFVGPPASAVDIDLDLQMEGLSPPTNLTDMLIKERLAVSKEAVTLLKNTQSSLSVPSEPSLVASDQRYTRRLKQEVPILLSDNELDMLRFGSAMEMSFNDLRIPLESIHDDPDNGLEWSPKCLALPEQCDARVRHEKLSVSRDILLYIQEATSHATLSEISEAIDESALYQQKVIAARCFWHQTDSDRRASPDQSLLHCSH